MICNECHMKLDNPTGLHMAIDCELYKQFSGLQGLGAEL